MFNKVLSAIHTFINNIVSDNSRPVPGKDAHWAGYCPNCQDMESCASRGGFYQDGRECVVHCYTCGHEWAMKIISTYDMVRSSYFHWKKWPRIPYNWHELPEEQRWKILGINQGKGGH
jgi:hypothetical protein